MMRGRSAAIPLLLAVLASGDRSEPGDHSQPRPRVRNPESDIHDLQSPIPKNVQWFDPTATELSDGGILNDAVKNVKKASETLKGLSGAVYDRIDEHRQNVEGVRDSMDKRDALINALDAQILGQLTDSDSSRMKAVNDATAGILPPVGDDDEDEGDLVDLAEGDEEEAGRKKKKAHLENYVSDFNPLVDDRDGAPFHDYEGKYRSQHHGKNFADDMGSRGYVGSSRSSRKSGKIPGSIGHDDFSEYDAPMPESRAGSGSRNPAVRQSYQAASRTADRFSSSRSSGRDDSLYDQGIGVSSGGRFTGKASVPKKSETQKRWEEEPLEEKTVDWSSVGRDRGDPRRTAASSVRGRSDSRRGEERLSPLLDSSWPEKDEESSPGFGSSSGGRTVAMSGAVSRQWSKEQRNARGIPTGRDRAGSSGGSSATKSGAASFQRNARTGIPPARMSGSTARTGIPPIPPPRSTSGAVGAVDRSFGRRDKPTSGSSRNVLKDSRVEDSVTARQREREEQEARTKISASKIPVHKSRLPSERAAARGWMTGADVDSNDVASARSDDKPFSGRGIFDLDSD